jgi:hypothetical protein
MPFAIKVQFGHNATKNSEGVRYYSQTIETLTENSGLDEIVILTTGEDPNEVDISSTLVEAEKKLEQLTINKKYKNVSSIKVVEFPEIINENKNSEEIL